MPNSSSFSYGSNYAVFDGGTLRFVNSQTEPKLLLGRAFASAEAQQKPTIQARSRMLSQGRPFLEKRAGSAPLSTLEILSMKVSGVQQSCLPPGELVELQLEGVGTLALGSQDFTVTISGGSLAVPVTAVVESYNNVTQILFFRVPENFPINGFQSSPTDAPSKVTVSVSGMSASVPASEYAFVSGFGFLIVQLEPDVTFTSLPYDFSANLPKWPSVVEVSGFRDYLIRFTRQPGSASYSVSVLRPVSGVMTVIPFDQLPGYLSHSGAYLGGIPHRPFISFKDVGLKGTERVLLNAKYESGFSYSDGRRSIVSASATTSMTPLGGDGSGGLSSAFAPDNSVGGNASDTYPLYRVVSSSQAQSQFFKFPQDGAFYFNYNPEGGMKAAGCNGFVKIPYTSTPAYSGPLKYVNVTVRVSEHLFVLAKLNGVLVAYSAFVNSGRSGSTDFNGSPAAVAQQTAIAAEFEFAHNYAYAKLNTAGSAEKKFTFTPFVSTEVIVLRFNIPNDGIQRQLEILAGYAFKIRPAYLGDTNFISDTAPYVSSFQVNGSVDVYPTFPVVDWDVYSRFNLNEVRNSQFNMQPISLATFTV